MYLIKSCFYYRFLVICIYALMAIFFFEYNYYTKPEELDDDDDEDAELDAIEHVSSF